LCTKQIISATCDDSTLSALVGTWPQVPKISNA
jgi:hypothetical protein